MDIKVTMMKYNNYCFIVNHFQKIVTATLKGFYDSIKGIFTVITIDKEINARNALRQSPTRTNSIVRHRNAQDRQARVLRQQE